MAKIYLNLNKEWFTKNMEKFFKAADDIDDAEQVGQGLLIQFDVPDTDDFQIQEDGTIKINGGTKPSGGQDYSNYVSVEFKPTLEELINLTTVVVRYYNKMKSAMESIKAI